MFNFSKKITLYMAFLAYLLPLPSFAEELKVAIFGFGGRVQDVLAECAMLRKETGKELNIVAICDNHIEESFDMFIKNSLSKEISEEYFEMFKGKVSYRDTKEGISALLKNHPDLDRIFITSSNDRHRDHLKAVLNESTCKNIYLEKPLFKNIQDFSEFNHDLGDREIQVGLSLRYAPITQSVAQQLKEYKNQLGKLKKVKSWEHVNFGHSMSIIMMNWRRYQSLSGGLLIEKAVHDIDLAFFFMESVDVHPESISMNTFSDHYFYKLSNKENIINTLLTDEMVRYKATRWVTKPWQRAIDYVFDNKGNVDWKATMDDFFAEFPKDDDFTNSDIIPDVQTIKAKINTTSGNTVDFELNVKLNEFENYTDRCCHLEFEKGKVRVDIEASKLYVDLTNQETIIIDLKLNRVRHSGGDAFIAHKILGTLPKGHFSANFKDPSVQISSVIGLISEHQAKHSIPTPIIIKKIDGRWSFDI
ncbi:MAG: hypothetical protein S4CHLAM20_11360 [Chlamydiia bacterium]|nr:hypothetical protein [Chlamydiia bacterium]